MEVTPAALSLRKRHLNAEDRKRLAKQATLTGA
jgi:predicted membrane GTPase involved in stress response